MNSRLINNSFDKICKLDRNDKEIRKQRTNDSALKTLQFRKKEQRLTFDEKVYVYSLLKQEGVEAKHIINKDLARLAILPQISEIPDFRQQSKTPNYLINS